MAIASEILPVSLVDEMRQSYLDYAMSVIVGRALPDVRDGMKPVHRRVLYAMNELGNDYNKAYKKSARIVGDVIGKYHPHGDQAVYDTIVRMAQPFSLRYMLVDGQGNFGSVDGDPAAAMRYTEIRMAKIAHEMLADLDKETVNFVPNYDGSESEPAVLPTRVPNLLINGSSGIAVGMATNIAPHNMTEVINGCVALLDDPGLGVTELMEYIPGPDFPTAGIINGVSGIREAYATGRGKVIIRAKAEVVLDHDGGRDAIIITELPYQVNKAKLQERISELVKEKKIEGLAAMRDESDKDGMRVVIELKRGEDGNVLLNQLYRLTMMQTTFGINTVALVDGQPKLLALKDMLELFLRHRREVVTRRTIYDLRKARERAHVLEGFAVALANIDPIIEMIKASKTPAEARSSLVAQVWPPGVVSELLQRSGAEASRPEELGREFGLLSDGYQLSQVQAQAILDLKLNRLTGMEQDKIVNEYKDILDKIHDLREILSDPDRLKTVIRDELLEILENYGDERRTQINANFQNLGMEDLISEEDMVVTLSHGGYAKRQPVTDYQAQRRGGRGKSATATKEDDFVAKLWVASTHDTMLCFSTAGKAYWLKAWEFPLAGRGSRGKPIVNLLNLDSDERITTVLPIRDYGPNGEGKEQFIFMTTLQGTVKKTPLEQFSRPRANGIIAIKLRDDDVLVDASLTDGESNVMLFSKAGKAIRFRETDVRSMGRTSTGVRGIRLKESDIVMSAFVSDGKGEVLTVSENGYGKRTELQQYPLRGRGGQGVIAIQTSDRNGNLVAAIQVATGEHLMLITDGGTLVRTAIDGISTSSRNTQGVTIIRMTKGEKLIGVQLVTEEDDEENDVVVNADSDQSTDAENIADDAGGDASDDTGEDNDQSITLDGSIDDN